MKEPENALLPLFSSTSEGPRDSENNSNHAERASSAGTSTWYKRRIIRSVDGCCPVYRYKRQKYKEWNAMQCGSLEIDIY